MSLKQLDGVQVSVRGRREAVNLRKRLQPFSDVRNKVVAFWKRAYPYNTLDSFWKRGMPAGAGMRTFWKRYMETANNDDLAAMFSQIVGPYNTIDKKNNRVQRLPQQRRAKEMSGRRPEFNPTGW